MLEKAEEYDDLAALVRGKATKNGSRTAFHFAGRSISFEALDQETDRVAAGLSSAGFSVGDRVGALLFNTPEFLQLWFGAAKAGVVLVPLNTALKGEILRYELGDSAPKGIVVDRRLSGVFEPARPSVDGAKVWAAGPHGGGSAGSDPDFLELLESRADPPSHHPRPQDPVAILYTSGTTGPPKGAIIPHRKMLTTSREIGERSVLDERSVLFTALPLFHCNAQEMTTLTALQNDRTAAFDERFHASTFWSVARSYGATHVSLLISMVNVLFKQPESPVDRSHGVRIALTAGATKALWPEFERRFGVEIHELYGMTECGCTTLMNPPTAVRVGSVGTPLGFVEADVVDDNDRPLAAGEQGELVVRPRQPFTMFLGYLNKPEETVRAWQNLWFHTGDYVRRDPDGYYYFIDRKKDVIRRRGENLAPYDVESVLNRHPAVFECVVVGVPSPLGEEDVKAFVQLKPGAVLSARDLFEFAIEHLPFFMVPRFLEFVDEIPKTANQKSQRYLLKQRPVGEVHDRESLGIRAAPPR